jgi:cytochrome c peroxidase
MLQYNQTQGDLYGGNFWDMRATGAYLQNPAAEQAQGPPVDPNEMSLPDTACVVRRLSQSPYRGFFEAVWGPQSFVIAWPADVDQVCANPGPPPANDPLPVHLSPVDRGRSNATYDQFALAIAAYEASPEVSPFSSKFDYALANPDQPILSADELAGWDLFRGKAKCNTCHLDGFSVTLNKTITMMITASTTSPVTAETALAMSRMMTSGLAKKRRNRIIGTARRVGTGSLNPYTSRRRRASSLLKPLSESRG